MPFAGDRQAAEAAVTSLSTLRVDGGDQLILVDNSDNAVASTLGERSPVTVLVAGGEQSPAHARNVGAGAARNDWVLFLDADTIPRDDLLDAFFDRGVEENVGAIAGEVHAASSDQTVAARYGAARNFLGQQSHYQHPYRPRAAAANLLVRKAAFEQLGGFYEGVRAGEDTDFSWRLQEAGWRLELRPEAGVEHRYRTTVGELRRQWRGYAAGRAWLGRRYHEFRPEPALRRALARTRSRDGARSRALESSFDSGPLDRGRFLALDVLLGLEELAGFALSNRPPADDSGRDTVDVVLVAERFPSRGDPLVELAGTLERVRVEAVRRPAALELEVARDVRVSYLEDEGAASRWVAAAAVALRHPFRATFDLLSRAPDAPAFRAVAPAVRRLERDSAARIHPLGGGHDRAAAERLARLAGRTLDR